MTSGHCSDWITVALANPPSKSHLKEAVNLFYWCLCVTNYILDFFDTSDISCQMMKWLQLPADTSGYDEGDEGDDDTSNAIFYLVWAIVALA